MGNRNPELTHCEIVAHLLARSDPRHSRSAEPPWGNLGCAGRALGADPETTLQERQALSDFRAQHGLDPEGADDAAYYYFIVEE